MKTVQFLRPRTALVHLRPKFFQPLDHGRPISNEPPSPPSSPNDNQSIKRIQSKDDYYMLSGPSLRSAFVFNIKLLVLSCFPLTSFHLAEASLSAYL